jgi:hypothetical protein
MTLGRRLQNAYLRKYDVYKNEEGFIRNMNNANNQICYHYCIIFVLISRMSKDNDLLQVYLRLEGSKNTSVGTRSQQQVGQQG